MDLEDTRISNFEQRISRLERRLNTIRDPATDSAVQKMILDLVQYITPMDPVGFDFVRVGQNFDGGYVMVQHDTASRIAYSLGINRDVSWDLAYASRGYTVFQYDHTIERLPQSDERFHFFKLGIAGSTNVPENFTSLEREVVRLGHGDVHDIVLKADIEGSEWDVFADIAVDDLRRFTQIAAEFHGFDKVHKLFWYRKAREALIKLHQTHQVVHVHGNNNSSMKVLGGVAIPPTLELTWLRRDLCDFVPCARSFPTPLDEPNNPNFADHMLGRFSFA